jgi:REP element-mobilizing transposase RayT
MLPENGIILCGYVFMPNHIHLLIYAKPTAKNLNRVIGDLKRFAAYEIVKRLKSQNEDGLLSILKNGLQEKEKAKNKQHQVFRLSFDAKELRGEEEITKVLDYIHHNPVSGKWDLVEDFAHYTYSSAQFYELGQDGFVKIIDYREVLYSESLAGDSEGE